MAQDKDKAETESGIPSAPVDPDTTDLPGEALADELVNPGAYEVSSDETEAEELTDEVGDEVDEAQLSPAEAVARVAASTRPVRRVPAAAEPAAKGHSTPKQSRTKAEAEAAKRATPAQFVRESAGELRKVVWPTASQLRQYFIVVLAFVLIVIGYVSALDLLFGWGLLKIFG